MEDYKNNFITCSYRLKCSKICNKYGSCKRRRSSWIYWCFIFKDSCIWPLYYIIIHIIAYLRGLCRLSRVVFIFLSKGLMHDICRVFSPRNLDEYLKTPKNHIDSPLRPPIRPKSIICHWFISTTWGGYFRKICTWLIF